MRFVLLALLLITGPTWAQKKLSPEAFQVNVRPVLNGILNDFYQMISLFPEFPRDLVGIVESLDTLAGDKEILRSDCPRLLEVKCLPAIESLRGKVTELNTRTLGMIARQKPLASPQMTSLSGMRVVNDFYAQLEEVKGALDNASFLLKANIKSKRETYPLIKRLDELNTLLSLTVVEYVPYTYREDFRHFYFNFVHPVQLHISKNKNYEFLNQNVNALNFALNLLNMNLTKRNKKTPEGMSPYLATMHNRWNSLLRYYF